MSETDFKNTEAFNDGCVEELKPLLIKLVKRVKALENQVAALSGGP